ncbi:ATPase [Marinobacter sp. OP 3.4]|uniref:ATPase n=1 Tax=Marinobacter sp. OP 3.4 TaxID=3076501 RepID=UPI002E208ABE
MEIKTYEELIDWVRNMHGLLARTLTEGADGNRNEQARALLNYLADHERELERITEEYERQAAPNTLHTRLYDYLTRSPVKVPDPRDSHFDSLGFDDICREIFAFHDRIIDIYHSLDEQAITPETHELVESLRQMETNEAMRLARQLASSQDM